MKNRLLLLVAIVEIVRWTIIYLFFNFVKSNLGSGIIIENENWLWFSSTFIVNILFASTGILCYINYKTYYVMIRFWFIFKGLFVLLTLVLLFSGMINIYTALLLIPVDVFLFFFLIFTPRPFNPDETLQQKQDTDNNKT